MYVLHRVASKIGKNPETAFSKVGDLWVGGNTFSIVLSLSCIREPVRDWSLITGGGGYRTGGGQVKFYPEEKGAGGGGDKRQLSHA